MKKKVHKFRVFCLAHLCGFFFFSIIISPNVYAFNTIEIGAFQFFQGIQQKEKVYLTTSNLVSDLSKGIQFQYQRTLGKKFNFKFKLENYTLKFITPPDGFSLDPESFPIINIDAEISYAHAPNWRSFLKIGLKDKILYNLDDVFVFHLYKTQVKQYGYGFTYDTQKQTGFVFGVGSSLSALKFDSQTLNNLSSETNYGADFEVRGKLGWISKKGWGSIIGFSYDIFYLPTKTQTIIGNENRIFAEMVKTY